MKTRLLRRSLLFIMLTTSLAVSLTSCKDEEKPKLIPEVTTAAISDVTTTTAKGGGEIISDGNDAIIASGLVFSATNSSPTILDSKTELMVSTGSFTILLENLTSGTTYHVKAYATNSMGTGYGEAVQFTTGNAAPVATNVTITGTVRVNETLSASYTFTDAENNTESGSTYQWYKADNASGSGESVIIGATGLTYQLQGVDEFKYIRFGVVPKSALGNMAGSEVKSAYVGSVAEATTVTFSYNGAQVTYGIITSSVTGKKWLDRNLGAPNVPATWNDRPNSGDLFQWGRDVDGHQLVNRATSPNTSVNGVSSSLSASDSPGHSFFISNDPFPSPFDWRNPQNDNLWKGVNATNNPCPPGWRIPTKTEWQVENLNIIQNAYNQLKITTGGIRRNYDGGFQSTLVTGYYWSSTTNGIYGVAFQFDDGGSTDPIKEFQARSYGHSCRCIKD